MFLIPLKNRKRGLFFTLKVVVFDTFLSKNGQKVVVYDTEKALFDPRKVVVSVSHLYIAIGYAFF